ncbi:MAG: arsenosugar biosynthesis radical SAM protein ArsS [Armatimonadota bacterium]|nr:arsenosugar biosynthesis radical SAM protein ArsS [Armatimonadota bacterium]
MITPVQTYPSFHHRIQAEGLNLSRLPLETLQINLGKQCNQACLHCHVEAGPLRTETMEWPTMERILELLRREVGIGVVDITGGAPELNPHFRRLVSELHGLGKTVLDRCNLTILLEEGQDDTARFLAENGVWIIASLPCYSQKNVDGQRGSGVFDRSVRALHILNDLGYGQPGSGLRLDLVYNPGGAYLPPPQQSLEADYRQELRDSLGIQFNHLFTITNMPIKRFLHDLERSGRLTEYMELLANSFNPEAAAGIMCRNLVSIGWDGQIYDCDFNQMLEIPAGGRPRTLWDIESLTELNNGRIAFGDHCYGCTAGAGSSCGGALV